MCPADCDAADETPPRVWVRGAIWKRHKIRYFEQGLSSCEGAATSIAMLGTWFASDWRAINFGSKAYPRSAEPIEENDLGATLRWLSPVVLSNGTTNP
ncbi:hypothetical protein [Salipiger sp. PrR003]|uniref:hypothetical protein n=1 Tax=Salipiger sp. PrR003 TaxID=2706776 RepID=UPI0013DB455C|nr:hypothetical protein [Salipiger sp. PrR003]NDV50304.1 hypothetical protein [Salipiger sp. PrR003]